MRRISWIVAAALAACSGGATKNEAFWKNVEDEATAAVAAFRQADPSISKFFDSATAYAVFPEVTKGGAGIGAAHGEGVLTEKGKVVGHCELSQASVGAQLGGQSFREIIFFQNETALKDFKSGDMELSARASAIAASKGAAAAADYREGVAVFTQSIGGLMFEASIGGQKFEYYEKK